LTVSATTSAARTAPSQPGDDDGAAGGAGLVDRGLQLLRHGSDQSASSCGRPATTAWPSTTPCTPRPSRFSKDSTGGSSPTRSRAAAAMARAIGVLAGVLERADQPQHLVLVAPDGGDRQQAHLARW
jgi:hypothetical protein